MEGRDDGLIGARRGKLSRVGRFGTATFRCSACAHTQAVDAGSVYHLHAMPELPRARAVEGPCLVCPFCGGYAYREGDPSLRRVAPAGASSVGQERRVPVCLKTVCDAIVSTPESRIAVLGLGTGEILYFSRRSRRERDNGSVTPAPHGRELDLWLASQPQGYERLPEFDAEERRSLMRRFVRTLGDDRIRERLAHLTEGYRPYSGFRRGLSQHPWHEGRWLEYSRRYVTPLVTDWLRDTGLILDVAGLRCR